MRKNSFRKEERLAKKKWIQELFEKGSSFHLYPFKVIFLPHPDPQHNLNQILISVPKRFFKRAVDRNKIKRRIREAYRLNKGMVPPEKKWLIAYIYTSKEILPSEIIHAKLPLILQRLK